MESLSVREGRRLALARAGLLKPGWTGFPTGGAGRGRRARAATLAVIRRFGYLQLDTVAVAGARSHVTVLLSRLKGLDPQLGEALLQPGEPLFEYWGHEASWIPLELYPAFAFRRSEFVHHPWWGDVVGAHPDIAKRLRRHIRNDGPIRSSEMEGRGGRGWWDLKAAKRVANALWLNGELAIRERCHFQRSYDLTERVIPEELRRASLSRRESFAVLLLQALSGHGWATTGTLAATWRLANCKAEIVATLEGLVETGEVHPCSLENPDGRPTQGWIRTADLDLAERVSAARPRPDVGVLLSPFDPLLWDRNRVRRLFGFDQILEIFKPAHKRVYGYYCLPVLAGERLVGRVDLKADRRAGRLRILSCHLESGRKDPRRATDVSATRTAVRRYADALQLRPAGRIG